MKKTRFVRKMLSVILAVALCFSTVSPAFATEGGAPEAFGENIYLGEENVEITRTAFIIDGTPFNKTESQTAVRSIRRMPNVPMMSATNEYGQILLTDLQASGALIAVGAALELIFLKVAFSLATSNIVSSAASSNALPFFCIPTGTFDGIDRDVWVIVGTTGLLIDGIGYGVSWFTYEIVRYIQDNLSSIPIDENIYWKYTIGDIAGEYGDFQCVEAAEAIKEALEAENKHGSIVMIQYPVEPGYVYSLTYNRLISKNGHHRGICYNGVVYCNVHPYGLPKAEWISDFEAIGEKIVTEISF